MMNSTKSENFLEYFFFLLCRCIKNATVTSVNSDFRSYIAKIFTRDLDNIPSLELVTTLASNHTLSWIFNRILLISRQDGFNVCYLFVTRKLQGVAYRTKIKLDFLSCLMPDITSVYKSRIPKWNTVG